MSTNKRQRIGLVKSIDMAAKRIVAHVSTFEWDRMNERFDKGAWDLKNYLLNPVVLWSHDPGEPPIGKAIRVSEDEQGLWTETQFDEKSEKAMAILGLYERGFLNAFSVGFIPKKWKFEGIEGSQEKGLVYLAAELLEYSAVSIPANPGAIVSREVAELVVKSMGDGVLTPIKHENTEGFLINPVDAPLQPVNAEADAHKENAEREAAAAAAATTPPAPAPHEILDNLLEVAKAAKGTKLDKTKVAMMGHAVQIFQEIIAENSESVERRDFDSLKSAVGSLSDVVKNLYPDASDTVRKIMSQVEKALTGRAA